MSVVYATPTGMKASSPRKGTKQAETRPLTLEGVGIVRHYPSAERLSLLLAESDPDKRHAIIAGWPVGTTITSGRVQVAADALAAFREDVLARVTPEAVAAVTKVQLATVAATVDGREIDEETRRQTFVARAIASETFARGIVILPTKERANGAGTKGADNTAATVEDLFPL